MSTVLRGPCPAVATPDPGAHVRGVLPDRIADLLGVQGLADEVRARVTRGSDVALRYVHVVGPKWIIKTSSGFSGIHSALVLKRFGG